jgi:signal transduction histidine kinase
MRERAELFGGDVEIASGAGQRTSVRVRVPYA